MTWSVVVTLESHFYWYCNEKENKKESIHITFIFISITTEKYYVHLALGESQFCYCTFKKIENNQAGSEES